MFLVKSFEIRDAQVSGRFKILKKEKSVSVIFKNLSTYLNRIKKCLKILETCLHLLDSIKFCLYLNFTYKRTFKGNYEKLLFEIIFKLTKVYFFIFV